MVVVLDVVVVVELVVLDVVVVELVVVLEVVVLEDVVVELVVEVVELVVVVVVVVCTASLVAATDHPKSAKVASGDAGPTMVRISPLVNELPEALAEVATVPDIAKVKVPNSTPFFLTENTVDAVAAVPATICESASPTGKDSDRDTGIR